MVSVQENILLAPHTTFKIGGVAKYFVGVNNTPELKSALEWAASRSEKIFVMGEGSNVLIADKGIDGLVIFLRCSDMEVRGANIWCFAGCKLMRLVETARDSALEGVEKLAGVPGTIGGAIRGNAGAFGMEINDTLTKVLAIHKETLEEKEFSPDECEFAYRASYFKKNPEWIVAEATFALAAGETSALRVVIEDTLARRNEKQDQSVQSAGSFFVNPVVEDKGLRREFEEEARTKSRGKKVPAGWLIDKVGLRGKKIGGAEVSNEHPNYIINAGNATAEDVIMLASYIKQQVRDTYNVELQREVQYIGF